VARIITGGASADEMRLAIVVARFNEFVTEPLLNAALGTIGECGGDPENTVVVKVPGAFEIPIAAKALTDSGDFDGIIALGAVIRGETPHFDFVAGEAARGILDVSLSSKVPIAFGVLTTDTVEQALERAGTNGGNKGAEAAEAVIEMVHVLRDIRN
jgi:6,7-dimethyl-8-ribityllumazine synthase